MDRLTDIQAFLPQEYQHKLILCDKILNAVKGAALCQQAFRKPFDSVQGAMQDLYASLATLSWAALSSQFAMESSANFVDQKYDHDGSLKSKRNRFGSIQSEKDALVAKKSYARRQNITQNRVFRGTERTSPFVNLVSH